MLQQITWKDYWTFIAVATSIYWLIIVSFFYKAEILAIAKWKNKTGTPEGDSSLSLQRENEKLSIEQTSLFNKDEVADIDHFSEDEEFFIEDEDLDEINLTPEAHALAIEIVQIILLYLSFWSFTLILKLILILLLKIHFVAIKPDLVIIFSKGIIEGVNVIIFAPQFLHMKDEFLRLIDILGTATFAISGVFAAMQKRLDLFGILIIAFITAIGGGTLRDMLIGDLPVNWMRSMETPLIILGSAIIAILFRQTIHNFQATLFIFDSLGLGFLTVLGMQKGISFGLSPGICIALGTVTGCFGGVIRDILLNNIPLIFKKEIYATACILGGLVYFLLLQTSFNIDWLDVVAIILIFLIRFLAVKFKLGLPVIYRDERQVD